MKNSRIRTEKNERSPVKHSPTRRILGIKDAVISRAGMLVPAFLTAVITLVVFLPALSNDFVSYDDEQFVYNNKHIMSIDSDFIKWAFTNRQYQWSPLRWISHAVDYKIWQLNPFGHHLSSVVLHSLNVFLLVLLVIGLLEVVRLKMPPSHAEEEAKFRRKAVIAGVVTGLLFGIHPLRVESVAWVAERKDVLFTFFFLLSLLSYLRYCRFPEDKRRPLYYLLTLAFFVMAVMSKAAAAALPLVLILLDFYPLERVNFRSGLNVWRRVLMEKLPFFGIGGVVAWVNIGVHESMGVLIPFVEVPFKDRVMLAFKSVLFYLMKMVWPFKMVLIYGEPYKVTFSVSEYIGLLFFMASVTALCIFLWYRGKRLWLAIWTYYIVMLLPVSVVKVLSFSFAHDRYTYMPSMGPFLLAGLGVAFLAGKMKSKSRVILFCLLIAGFSFLAFLTIKQEAVWKNSVTLWSSVIERTPRFYRAYYDRGCAYLEEAKYTEAIKDFTKIIEWKPFEEVYNKRGVAYKGTGEYPAALRDFSQAIQLQPGYTAAYNNRADVYLQTGNYQKAMEDLNRALELDPDYNVTRINLCALYNSMGQFQQALKECSTAIEMDPGNAGAYKRRGFSYNSLGNYKEAIRDYDRAIELNSNDYETYDFRGIAIKNDGDPSMAIRDFTRAVELNPAFFDAYIIRGVTYGELGRLEEAVHDFTAAIGLRPQDAAAYYNRGAAYYRLGRENEAMEDFRKAARLGDKEIQKILRSRGVRW
jgi:tetratricopeptide (TPR) repeat protein